MKREQELEKRRYHVEQLLKWQQRLDREERDVIEMERKIMKNAAITHSRSKTHNPHAIYFDHPTNTVTKVSDHNESHDSARSYRKIKEIESSLTVLQNLPNRTNSIENDYVSTSGNKLNKLWRRLTGESAEKFNASQRYHLSKNDLEQIYEEAKSIVLQRFNSSTDVLNGLDKTMLLESTDPCHNDVNGNSKNESIETIVQNTAGSCNHQQFDEDSLNSIANIETDAIAERRSDTIKQPLIVPLLNLNFSPEPTSDIGTDVISDDGGGYYLSEVKDEKEKKFDENSETIPEALTTSSTDKSLSETVVHSEIESQSTPIIAQNEIVSRLQQFPSLTLNEESIIMIDDVSFPNIDISINNDDIVIADNEQITAAQTFTIIDTYNNDQQQQQYTKIKEITTTTLEFNDKYLSDDFDSDDKTTPTTTMTTKPSKCLSDTESKISSYKSNHYTETILTIAEENLQCNNSEAVQEENSENNTISDNNIESNSSGVKSKELEQRLIDIDESLKDINDTINKSPIMELSSKSPSPERSLKQHTLDVNLMSPPSSSSSSIVSDDSNKENDNGNQQQSVIASTGFVLPLTSLKTVRNLNGFEVYPAAAVSPAPPPPPPPPSIPKPIDDSGKAAIRDYVSPSTDYKIPNKMPDIISEAEVLRRQQLQIEQEVNLLFHIVSFYVIFV